ncbi:MAG: GGDEF domain-containing protein [Planctomycetaceae bacterium]|nr:GGDEF domain-containing protein [Planctomycetaceae bacterium]
MTPFIFSPLLAVQNGYLLALILICLLQFLIHVMRVKRLRRKMAEDADKLRTLQREVSSLQKDRAQIRFEHQIFEEFIVQPNFEEAMKLLLKRSLPVPGQGFGAWLEKRKETFLWSHFRGLPEDELKPIPVTEDWSQEFGRREFHLLQQDEIEKSILYNYLPESARERLKQLFVFPVKHQQEITGLMITTALYPAGMTLEGRVSLALRLLNGLERHFRHSQELRIQQTELKTKQEVLELRDLADRYANNVRELVDQYLSCLARQLECDRGLIAFSNDDNFQNIRAIQRVGIKPDEGQQEKWDRDEGHLIRIAAHRKRRLILDPAELDIYGFSGPLKNVILIPMIPRQGTYGVMCLMRHEETAFSEEERHHSEWAGDYLNETLRRSLDQATMEILATCDPLTGLLNRRAFQEKLDKELIKADDRSEPCSLVMVDLDHFKKINDTFGHLMGDQVLRRVAKTMKLTLENEERLQKVLAARYGGEELAVILPRLEGREAMRVGEKLRAQIAALELEFHGKPCPVTASIGVSCYPDQASGAEEAIAFADKALYRAKSAGRNQVCLFSPTEDLLLEN